MRSFLTSWITDICDIAFFADFQLPSMNKSVSRTARPLCPTQRMLMVLDLMLKNVAILDIMDPKYM